MRTVSPTAGELHQGHVLTGEVVDHIRAAEAYPGGQPHHRSHNTRAPGRRRPHQAGQQPAGHYLWVAEWVADGNVAVQGHDQEDVAVEGDEEVDAEHLGQAARQGDAAEAGGEAEQHGGQHGAGGTDVDGQQQGDEQVHGLVQAPLGRHRVDDQGVGGDDGQVEAEEGQHQERAGLLQPREAQQEEAGVGQAGAVVAPH